MCASQPDACFSTSLGGDILLSGGGDNGVVVWIVVLWLAVRGGDFGDTKFHGYLLVLGLRAEGV